MNRALDRPWLALLSWNKDLPPDLWTLAPPRSWIDANGRFPISAEVCEARIRFIQGERP